MWNFIITANLYHITADQIKPLGFFVFISPFKKQLHTKTDTQKWFSAIYKFFNKRNEFIIFQSSHCPWKCTNTRKHKTIISIYIFFFSTIYYNSFSADIFKCFLYTI